MGVTVAPATPKPGSSKCPACQGYRMVSGADGAVQKCPICDGQGAVKRPATPWFYDYVINQVVTGNGAAAPTKQIASDSAFEWLFIVGSATSNLLTVQMTDSSRSSQPLSDAPINFANWAGSAQQPFPLVFAYYLPPLTVLTFALADSSGNPNTVQIVLRGHKLYPSLQGS